jgi:hypothetical protein
VGTAKVGNKAQEMFVKKYKIPLSSISKLKTYQNR